MRSSAAVKKGGSPRPAIPTLLKLEYSLAELPSSQHRSGLAGLVMVVRWLQRKALPSGCVCRVTRCDARGAAFEFDQAGLRALFDEVYSASYEEQSRDAPLKNPRTKQVVPYLRTELVERQDKRTGKPATKEVYVYRVVVPRGSFLLDVDPSRTGENGAWIKLWRDMIWSILRGVPATRTPFEARAEHVSASDATEAWELLTGKEADGSVRLPSTYFIGAMESTAESVPFRDRARFQFLLHYWPLVAQVYVPATIDRDGKSQFKGYAVAVCDVADLQTFCGELEPLLKERGTEMRGYRPREAVVELALESALDLMRRLSARLAVRKEFDRTSDLVLGVDVFHLEKRGNNVTLLGSGRVTPRRQMLDEYDRVRAAYSDSTFRTVRIGSVLAERPWHAGFEVIFKALPYERFLGREALWFRRDARRAFDEREGERSGNLNETDTRVEKLVYDFVGTFVRRRLESKYQLKWAEVKDDPKRKASYEEKKEKVAKEAFLAIRSRSGEDFVAYFSSTLGSVPQFLKEDDFAFLARALRDRTEEMRTLTLLALSAHS